MLSAFVLALLIAVGALGYVQVSRIFNHLTPAVERDLKWKSERGTAELSFTLELGLALGEKEAIAKAASAYLNDADVRRLVVLDAENRVVFSYPDAGTRESREALFSSLPKLVYENPDAFRSWSHVEIEGANIGKVGLEIKKERLLAGDDLRKRILWGVILGCLGALVVSLFFVSAYIGPLIDVTERAFADVEERTKEAVEWARR
jgi:hypothetical protein